MIHEYRAASCAGIILVRSTRCYAGHPSARHRGNRRCTVPALLLPRFLLPSRPANRFGASRPCCRILKLEREMSRTLEESGCRQFWNITVRHTVTTKFLPNTNSSWCSLYLGSPSLCACAPCFLAVPSRDSLHLPGSGHGLSSATIRT